MISAHTPLRRLLLVLAITASAQPGAAQPVVTESREGGNSVIRIRPTDGGEKIFRIDLFRRHAPAAEKTEALEKWESWRLGAFVCFNTNQFTGEELCKARDARIYNPSQLDVAGWVTAFKDAGMKYAVLTTRHTSGFSLWNSSTTDFDVAGSGNKTDVCKEFVGQCRRQGLAPGFYYCLWGGKDWNPHPNARAIILAQLYELATQFGEIPYFWIDMMCWAPPNLSTQEIYDCLKSLQPNCVVIFNQHIQDGRKIAYFPTDVLNGELTLPPQSGHTPVRKVGEKTYYLPFEYEPVSQNRPGGYTYDPFGPSCWFTYGEGNPFKPSRPFPAEAVAKRIRLGWERGAANVLLATAPDHTGRMRAQDVEQLRQIGRILRGTAADNPSLDTADFDTAISKPTAGVPLEPQSATGHFLRGMEHKDKGEYEKAIADFTEAIRLNPQHVGAYCMRGLAHREKGDFDKAIADQTQAIRLDPNDASAFGLRGIAYRDKGYFDKAIADQTREIRLHPKDDNAYVCRGWTYVKKGDYDKAIEDFTEGIRLRPNNGHAYVARGWAYKQKGEQAKAEADLARAKKLGCDVP